MSVLDVSQQRYQKGNARWNQQLTISRLGTITKRTEGSKKEKEDVMCQASHVKLGKVPPQLFFLLPLSSFLAKFIYGSEVIRLGVLGVGNFYFLLCLVNFHKTLASGQKIKF